MYSNNHIGLAAETVEVNQLKDAAKGVAELMLPDVKFQDGEFFSMQVGRERVCFVTEMVLRELGRRELLRIDDVTDYLAGNQ